MFMTSVLYSLHTYTFTLCLIKWLDTDVRYRWEKLAFTPVTVTFEEEIDNLFPAAVCKPQDLRQLLPMHYHYYPMQSQPTRNHSSMDARPGEWAWDPSYKGQNAVMHLRYNELSFKKSWWIVDGIHTIPYVLH